MLGKQWPNRRGTLGKEALRSKCDELKNSNIKQYLFSMSCVYTIEK